MYTSFPLSVARMYQDSQPRQSEQAPIGSCNKKSRPAVNKLFKFNKQADNPGLAAALLAVIVRWVATLAIPKAVQTVRKRNDN